MKAPKNAIITSTELGPTYQPTSIITFISSADLIAHRFRVGRHCSSEWHQVKPGSLRRPSLTHCIERIQVMSLKQNAKSTTVVLPMYDIPHVSHHDVQPSLETSRHQISVRVKNDRNRGSHKRQRYPRTDTSIWHVGANHITDKKSFILYRNLESLTQSLLLHLYKTDALQRSLELPAEVEADLKS
jgi:hypothetical protein